LSTREIRPPLSRFYPSSAAPILSWPSSPPRFPPRTSVPCFHNTSSHGLSYETDGEPPESHWLFRVSEIRGWDHLCRWPDLHEVSVRAPERLAPPDCAAFSSAAPNRNPLQQYLLSD
jgi:hypothetical protein